MFMLRNSGSTKICELFRVVEAIFQRDRDKNDLSELFYRD